MNRRGLWYFRITCSFLFLFSLTAVFSGTAVSSILFEDDFSGTVIDPAKWTTRTPCAYSDADCSAYASVTQNENLQLTVTRGNYVFAQAISAMQFEEAGSFECEVWQDEISSWQDYPFGMSTPLGAFSYYNVWGWQIDWRTGSGALQTNHSLSMPPLASWQHFRLRVQLLGNELQWLYDVGDGAGYQLAFSTTDFSLPFYRDGQPAEDINRMMFSVSDQRTTYVDNVRVESAGPLLPACSDCGAACEPLANGYQLIENITGEQTTRFQVGAWPVTLSDQ